jgi:CheY-like chemotaxis protein
MFLDQLTESIGIVLNTIAASMRTEELLKQSQSLAEELQAQQKELTETNTRLEQQAQSLTASEELLKEQQEQLQQTNAELEEKAELLVVQNREVERKNSEIEQARRSLEEKAEQLALTSRYKSEFLANMSHELRTPLNSLLILARLLSENGSSNLTEKQVEYARTIYSSGNDLLALINDILDLAKIESGTMSVDVDQILFNDLREYLDRTFRQVAQDKKLNFAIELNEQLPRAIDSDSKRLQQVLKNLLANAFKFTERGQVKLDIRVATSGWSIDHETLNRADRVIAFSVTDTGIGIAPDKQQIIFEAFQQADGTTSRKYGGTGLGLSISREITRLLGGELRLTSTLGLGSTFTLYLPQIYLAVENKIQEPSNIRNIGNVSSISSARREVGSKNRPIDPLATPLITPSFIDSKIADDRENIHAGDQVLLIIEDDLSFARILLDMARQEGFKGIIATRGDLGIAMAREFKPVAIMLDIRLPAMDGWMVLDRLKHDPSTRHIPVHTMSVEEGQQRSLQQGAIAYLQKPISSEALSGALTNIKQFVERPVKRLLIVEDDEVQRNSIADLIGNGDVTSIAVGTGADALEALKLGQYDCIVLDLGLPDMTGFELIEQIKQEMALRYLPIIVYTGKDLTPQEETELRRVSETIIVKDVRSPERLLDETALFLHRVQANLPDTQRQMLEQLYQNDPVLAGKKVLIIDDDVRNIFALTSLLEHYEIEVFYAENGQDGIILLQNHADINIALVDIMMPEMDGYETMRTIRQAEQFSGLPMIALTAKAMKGDREKCLEAGASDYITKPVDIEQLLSLLRVWLYPRSESML